MIVTNIGDTAGAAVGHTTGSAVGIAVAHTTGTAVGTAVGTGVAAVPHPASMAAAISKDTTINILFFIVLSFRISLWTD
jgi:hypothetical protein